MRITLPHVGESVTEAVIERWLKQVGDHVEKYEPLAEVVTDKVSMEMPSPVDGILVDILVDAGQTIPMGAEIAEIATETTTPPPRTPRPRKRRHRRKPWTGSGRSSRTPQTSAPQGRAGRLQRALSRAVPRLERATRLPS